MTERLTGVRMLGGLACVVLPLLVAAEAAGGAERPNLVFIMADDLGKEWLSCYGSECHRTPVLDELASGGMRFESVYATPLCTPTRVMLLTGRYPFHTGWVVHHDTPRWGGQYFDWKRETTFARVLRAAGYATAIAGKWQINDLRVQPDALRRHGFDEHCVWTGFETGNPPSGERYYNAYIQCNGERRTYEGRFGPDVFADFLVDFMRRHRDGPFLVYYPMVLTHQPMTKTPLNQGDPPAKGHDQYAGMIDYVEFNVARIVGVLDELGLREKTIVFFTGDNGSPGTTCRANGRDVFGGKTFLTETGVCMPFIVNAPGRVPAGRVSHELIDFTDMLPTFAELAGAKVPAGTKIDGISFASVLAGKEPQPPRREWIFSQLGKNRVVREKRYKLYSDGRLFDVVADPLEERDLSASHEAAVVAARKRLQAVLESLPANAKLPFPPRIRPATQPKPLKKAGAGAGP
jgi:arylsulfatase A-like enzyme